MTARRLASALAPVFATFFGVMLASACSSDPGLVLAELQFGRRLRRGRRGGSGNMAAAGTSSSAAGSTSIAGTSSSGGGSGVAGQRSCGQHWSLRAAAEWRQHGSRGQQQPLRHTEGTGARPAARPHPAMTPSTSSSSTTST